MNYNDLPCQHQKQLKKYIFSKLYNICFNNWGILNLSLKFPGIQEVKSANWNELEGNKSE